MPITLFLGWKHTKLNSLLVSFHLWSCINCNLILVSHFRLTEVLKQNWELPWTSKTLLCAISIYLHAQTCMFLNSILKLQNKHNKNILEAVQFLYCFSVSVIWRSCHSSLNYSDKANYKSSSSQNNSTYVTLWQLQLSYMMHAIIFRFKIIWCIIENYKCEFQHLTPLPGRK